MQIEGDIRSQSPWLREFGFEFVDRADAKTDNRGVARLRTAYLLGSFSFEDDGLNWYTAYGRYVRTKENQDFASLLGQHLAWSDSDISSALGSQGAQFGPGPGVLRVMESEARRIAPAVADVFEAGALVMSSVKFTFPTQHDRRGGLGSSYWEVIYNSSSGSTDVAYGAHFEPFGGRLIRLFRQ